MCFIKVLYERQRQSSGCCEAEGNYARFPFILEL